ncbi:MAG: ATP-binding protein, partial [Candidatus Omnitrophota bacterium]
MTDNLFRKTLADIMSKDTVIVRVDESVAVAVKKMEERNIGAVMVEDARGNVAGIFSERDLCNRVVSRGMDPLLTAVSEVMTADPKSLGPGVYVSDAFKLLEGGKFRHIPVMDGGTLVGIVSVRDINKTFYEERKALDEMKTKFAMITSHELRTPGSIIALCVDSILQSCAECASADKKRIVDLLHKNAKRLETILKDLASLYLGFLPPSERDLDCVSVGDLVRMSVDDVTPFVVKRHQVLTCDIGNDASDILIKRRGIRQVLVNLLLNAVRFTPDNGKITLRAMSQAGASRFEVEDTGIGIAADKISSIFESFYEAQDTMKHSSGSINFGSSGMGLGLAIAKNIVDAQGGRIWAESVEGVFSRFIVTLPRSGHCPPEKINLT